jgi:Fe-S-cluster-containing dehydrogenase component
MIVEIIILRKVYVSDILLSVMYSYNMCIGYNLCSIACNIMYSVDMKVPIPYSTRIVKANSIVSHNFQDRKNCPVEYARRIRSIIETEIVP